MLAESHTPSSIGKLAHEKLSNNNGGVMPVPSEEQLASTLVLLRRPHLEMLLTATLRSRAQFLRAVDQPDLLQMQRTQSRLYAEQQQSQPQPQPSLQAEKRRAPGTGEAARPSGLGTDRADSGTSLAIMYSSYTMAHGWLAGWLVAQVEEQAYRIAPSEAEGKALFSRAKMLIRRPVGREGSARRTRMLKSLMRVRQSEPRAAENVPGPLVGRILLM